MLAALAAVVWALPAAAGQERVYVPSDEHKAGNYYAAGESVEVAGSVDSDLIVAGGDVIVSGNVGGDVIAVGGNVRIVGQVQGDVRVFGGRVELAGTVERNVTAAAGELRFMAGSDIKGHVTAAAGTIETRGRIGGSLLAAAGQVTAAGSIEGPATLWLDRQGRLDVRESALFGSSLTYYADQEALVSSRATLSQEPQRYPLPVPKRTSGSWFGHLVSLFGALVLAMVMVKLAPQRLRETVQLVIKRPLPSLGFGALWLVTVPIAVIVLAITLIGLPVAVLLGLMYAAGLILSPVIAGATVAEFVHHRSLAQTVLAKLSPFASVAMGVAAYKLATFVPVVGGLVGFVGTLFALGALVQRLFRRHDPAYGAQS